MCGIAGVVRWDNHPVTSECIDGMITPLTRRGPDGFGIHADGRVGLGHRRLAIIDLSERGKQPLCNEDGSVWITFNGEIYNYRDLKPGLLQRGHTFQSDSDTEVIVHLYEECRDDLNRLFRALRGMFALAIWDRTRNRVILARDRLGIKPLVYHQSSRFCAFASDANGLLGYPEVPRRLDWTSVYDYLTLLSVPEPHTIYADVSCLPPGHWMELTDRPGTPQCYWTLEREREIPKSKSKSGAQDSSLEALLEDAVRLHLIADLEVGSFLSGGVDSGLVTALAVQCRNHEGTTTPLRTFSASFPGEAVDEGPWARESARVLGTRHDEFSITSGFFDDLETIVGMLDQPLGTPSMTPLFQIAKRCRERVTVVLTGDGGDEIFGGYSRHRPDPPPWRGLASVPPALWPALGQLGSRAIPPWLGRRSKVLHKLRLLSQALLRDETECYAPRLWVMPPGLALSLLPPEGAAAVDTGRYVRRIRQLFRESPYRDPLNRRLHVDMKTSLVDEMLFKVDRVTMAHGLEARVPLLDHEVVRMGMNYPGSAKRAGDSGKLPLRRLVSRYLGEETGNRGKHGFNTPVDRWMRDDATTRSQYDALWESVAACPVFHTEALRRAAENRGSPTGCSGVNLFSILVFGLWFSGRKSIIL